MIKDGDAKEGRSAYNVKCCNEDNDVAIESRTELWRHDINNNNNNNKNNNNNLI